MGQNGSIDSSLIRQESPIRTFSSIRHSARHRRHHQITKRVIHNINPCIVARGFIKLGQSLKTNKKSNLIKENASIKLMCPLWTVKNRPSSSSFSLRPNNTPLKVALCMIVPLFLLFLYNKAAQVHMIYLATLNNCLIDSIYHNASGTERG